MSFRRRTYPEVLENLLTTITGGVASESQPFPPPGATKPPYILRAAAAARRPTSSPIWGARDGQPHEFRKGADYQLASDGRTLVLPEKGADFPDPGTLLYVNYVPAAAQPELTDLQIGSVLRTLSETTALELGRLYALLESVYQSGFVDTASADALDNVVALLGIERVRGGRPAGEVEFTRAAGAPGELTIPAGTRVATADGKVQYATTETVSMSPGQGSIRVAARDLEPNDPLPAGALTLLPVPIAGIASVTNPAPTAIATAGRDRRRAAHAREELPARQRAGHARRARAGPARRRHHRRHRRVHRAGDGHDHPARRLAAARPAAAARPTRSSSSGPPASWCRSGRRSRRGRSTSNCGSTTADGPARAGPACGPARRSGDRIADFFTAPADEGPGEHQPARRARTRRRRRRRTSSSSAATWRERRPARERARRRRGGSSTSPAIATVLGELHIADPNLPTTLERDGLVPGARPHPADVPAIRAALTRRARRDQRRERVGYGTDARLRPAARDGAPPGPLRPDGLDPGRRLAADGIDVAPYKVTLVLTLESGLSVDPRGATPTPTR